MNPKPSVSIDSGDPLRRLLEREAERLEDVGGSRHRADRPVPVLRDRSPRRRSDDRSRRRDVERPPAVAARPDDVDHVVARRPHLQHVSPHRLRAAGDLVRGLALRPQRDQEPADLRGRRFASHDLAHHLACLVAPEVVPVEQLLDRSLDHGAKCDRPLTQRGC